MSKSDIELGNGDVCVTTGKKDKYYLSFSKLTTVQTIGSPIVSQDINLGEPLAKINFSNTASVQVCIDALNHLKDVMENKHVGTWRRSSSVIVNVSDL